MEVLRMPDLAILVPSRGRPEQLDKLLRALTHTCSAPFMVYVGLDDDDPDIAQYASVTDALNAGQAPVDFMVYTSVGPRRSLADWTNDLALTAMRELAPPFLASLGDDHRPVTVGWDVELMAAVGRLPGPGWAYGNDLFQGPRLPTAWVQSSALFSGLGWVMPRALRHMYVDNVVYDLGRHANRITYCPDVVVEHRHPYAGKGSWDGLYETNSQGARFIEDRAAYERWRLEEFKRDAETVAALEWGA